MNKRQWSETGSRDAVAGSRRPQGVIKLVAALALAGVASGCATPGSGGAGGPGSLLQQIYANDDPCANNARNLGITLGTIGGALAGQALGGNGNKIAGVVVGAGLGALIGGLIGQDIDRRRCELSKIAKANNLELTMTAIELPGAAAEGDAVAAKPDETRVVGLSVSVTDSGDQFAAGAARPSPRAASAFADIARAYQIDAASAASPQARQQIAERGRKMRLLLVGHTDDTGSSQLNADLSQARAKAVARIFAEHGFTPDQVYYQGAGETLPIADNRTEAGRARNRRVEIVDLSDEQAFAAYLAARKPNLSYYRPAGETVSASPGVGAGTGTVAGDKVAEPKSRAPKSQAGTAGKRTARTPAGPASAPVAAAAEVDKDSVKERARATVKPASGRVQATVVDRPQAATGMAGIDFGGSVIGAQARVPDIGIAATPASSFSLIPSAYAASEPVPVGNCTQDRPRIRHGVKSLQDDKAARFATKDYMPGAYGTSWSDTVNGHLVALTHVAVLRDGGQPAGRPDVLVYRNYAPGSNPKPDLSLAADVNAYLGSKAMLYRVFLPSGPLRCIDMVIPNQAASTAPGSVLVYQRDSALFQADFSPAIAR